MQALEVHRVPSSADPSSLGDLAFIQKREPVRKFERIPPQAPKALTRKLPWQAFGKGMSLSK